MKIKSIKKHYIDISFLPETDDSLIELINDNLKEDLFFPLKELRKFNKLYSEGFRDFTISEYNGVVYGIFPKNHLLKDYGLWIVIDSKKIKLVLYDVNSNTVVGVESANLKQQFDQREEFEKEIDFFRKTLFIEINDLFDSITRNTNIRPKDIGHIVKAGDPVFSYLLYDLFPSEDIRPSLVKRFPVKSAGDLGLTSFSNAFFIDLGCERNSDSLFMFIASINAQKKNNDFILMISDWIGCYNQKENLFTYISGIVENQLYEKISDYMKKNLISLPVDIEIVKYEDIENYIKSFYLSQGDFSDSMKIKNFDIGILGIW